MRRRGDTTSPALPVEPSLTEPYRILPSRTLANLTELYRTTTEQNRTASPTWTVINLNFRPRRSTPPLSPARHRSLVRGCSSGRQSPPWCLSVVMATANVTLENQLQSAQKNLLFLQQNHAVTLKGLHAEVRRLQQQCTDLTYELTVRSCDPSGSGEERCRALARRCGELEAELRAKREENAELLRELEQKSALVAVLENSIKEREKKYLEELKTKSHKMAALSGELEQRAGTIAYLTSQLHATKKKLLAGGSSDASPDVSPVGSYKPAPPPPPPTTTKKKDRQPETPRRRMKKSLSQPLHPERTEVYRLGPDGKRVILRETTTTSGVGVGGGVDAMPDPTPFLQARRESPEPQVVRERPAVIPPIPASERSPVPPALDAPRDRRGLGAHVGVAHRISHAAATAATAAPSATTPTLSRPLQAEVETVAVDQVGEEKVVRERAGPHRTV